MKDNVLRPEQKELIGWVWGSHSKRFLLSPDFILSTFVYMPESDPERPDLSIKRLVASPESDAYVERCRWSESIGEGTNGIEGREVLVKVTLLGFFFLLGTGPPLCSSERSRLPTTRQDSAAVSQGCNPRSVRPGRK